mgnify:FL=1
MLTSLRRVACILSWVGWVGSVGSAWGETVALQGMLGTRALLIVDGNAPKGVAVGDSYLGVKVLSTTSDSAVVEVNGQRLTLRLGESPGHVGANGPRPVGGKIVLTASSGGHFVTSGSINGQTAQFMVDTGATLVAIGSNDADRMSINYRDGQPIRTGTANGVGLAWKIKLSSVRIADVELRDVDAVVTLQPMSQVLLGNSFLNRFQMRRDSDQMTLERRY